MSRCTALPVCVLAAGLLAGCAEAPPELSISTPDRARFTTEVYPVLLRDCGFNACHGSGERFFQVYGAGRGRLLPDLTQPLDMPTEPEIARSYDRARSMIDATDPMRSLLLRKPLATEAGGTGHEGVDALGRNVYQSKLEPGYMKLEAWVLAQPVPALPQP